MPKAITLTIVSLPQRAVSRKETSPKYSGVTSSLLPTSLERLVNQKSIFLETAENNFTPHSDVRGGGRKIEGTSEIVMTQNCLPPVRPPDHLLEIEKKESTFVLKRPIFRCFP